MPDPSDFAAVHDRLRRLLEPYRARFAVTADGPTGMTLEVPGLEGRTWGYVAGTRVGKRYVSYYLMPVYADARLQASISPELAKRRQGKSCFNFTRVDEPLLAQLGALTERSLAGWEARARAVDAERRGKA